MKKTKRQTKIMEALAALNTKDIYSLMLFTLFKLKDDPQYSTLSELCYILDGKNLTNFLSYYGGMTITIPKLKDLRKVTQALLLYQYVNLEGESFDEALEVVAGDEFMVDEIKEIYQKLLDVVANYEFGD